jgi:GAF domain-containing protein
VTRPDLNEPPAGPAQAAFEELGRISFAEHSLQSLIQTVTDLAARVIPGDPVTSVTIVSQGSPRTVASSGEPAVVLDRVQYGLGDGPCLTAAIEGRPEEVLDTLTERRWPEFAQRAADLGVRSVLSVPLPVQELVTGGLNVYSRRPHGSDEGNRELATRFASYAVIPVSNMYLYTSAVERVGHLEAALDSRAVIDQAKGILMERYRLTADQAFQALARVSMETNTKVRDVAQHMVDTGNLEPS